MPSSVIDVGRWAAKIFLERKEKLMTALKKECEIKWILNAVPQLTIKILQRVKGFAIIIIFLYSANDATKLDTHKWLYSAISDDHVTHHYGIFFLKR